MTETQIILDVITKMMFPRAFASSLQLHEKDFITSITDSTLKNFRMENYHSKTILIWTCEDVHDELAVYVDDKSISFSSVECYKKSTHKMKGLAKKKLLSDEMQIVEEQINTLKTIFIQYLPEVERLFN